MTLRAMKVSINVASIALTISLLLSTPAARAGAAPAGLSTAPTTISPAVAIPHGTVTLVAEKSVIDPHGELWLALHFVLEPGWHTYWINPGDSGEAPRLIWHLPAGLTAGAISWPAPKKMSPEPTVTDFGFTDDAVLLVPLRSAGGLKPGAPANLDLEIRLIVCREVCIPGRAQVSLSLPVGAPLAGGTARPAPQVANLFASARAHLPKPSPAAWKFHASQTKDEFVLDVDTGHTIPRAMFFPIDEDEIANAAPQPVEAMAKGFRMHLRKSDQLIRPVKQLHGVLELDGAAYSTNAPVS